MSAGKAVQIVVVHTFEQQCPLRQSLSRLHVLPIVPRTTQSTAEQVPLQQWPLWHPVSVVQAAPVAAPQAAIWQSPLQQTFDEHKLLLEQISPVVSKHADAEQTLLQQLPERQSAPALQAPPLPT